MSKISKWGMTIDAIVAISLIFSGSICAYRISHDHHTPVLVKGEWLTGEYRVCLMPGGVSLPDSARLVCPQSSTLLQVYLSGLSGDEMQAFSAHNWDAFAEPFHDIPVTYKGRIDRTDRGLHDDYAWQCVRQEGIIHNISLSCRALN